MSHISYKNHQIINSTLSAGNAAIDNFQPRFAKPKDIQVELGEVAADHIIKIVHRCKP